MPAKHNRETKVEDDIEYNYVINRVATEESGQTVAEVTYTPVDARLRAVTRNVSLPLDKAKDASHAREITESKVRQRAPTTEWAEALRLIDEPEPLPAEDARREVEALVGKPVEVRKPKPRSRRDQIRERFLADTPRGEE